MYALSVLEEIGIHIKYTYGNAHYNAGPACFDNNMDISLPDIEGEVKIDSLIFEVGQILYFDFTCITIKFF